MAKSVTKSIVCQLAAETGVISVLISLRMLSALKIAKKILLSLYVHFGKEVLAVMREHVTLIRTSVASMMPSARGV